MDLEGHDESHFARKHCARNGAEPQHSRGWRGGTRPAWRATSHRAYRQDLRNQVKLDPLTTVPPPNRYYTW